MKPDKKKVIKKYEFFDMWRVTYDNIGDGNPFTMDAAFSKEGIYIGEQSTAEFLVKKGIEHFEKRKDDSTVCSIGYIPKEKAWFGWSHRALASFKIGDKCTKGDCGYTREKGQWTAKNMNDVKQMAWDFAEGVS